MNGWLISNAKRIFLIALLCILAFIIVTRNSHEGDSSADKFVPTVMTTDAVNQTDNPHERTVEAEQQIYEAAPDQQGQTISIASEADLSRLEMDDPLLIEFIREHYLQPPGTEAYNLTRPNQTDYSQVGQSQLVAQFFENRNLTTPGTFFEAGAFDGEMFSNSLYFEKTLHWHGVLVEPDPSNLAALRSKNRKATTVGSCLSGLRPVKATFECRLNMASCTLIGTVASSNTTSLLTAYNSSQPISVGIWCFPLLSVLLAANCSSIDYMVLDLEYYELVVLHHFPFHKFPVKLIQLEYGVMSAAGGSDDAAAAIRLQSFKDFFSLKWPMFRLLNITLLDVIFVNTELVKL